MNGTNRSFIRLSKNRAVLLRLSSKAIPLCLCAKRNKEIKTNVMSAHSQRLSQLNVTKNITEPDAPALDRENQLKSHGHETRPYAHTQVKRTYLARDLQLKD